jgi:uncharacterized protein YlxW (UPF0749 family)
MYGSGRPADDSALKPPRRKKPGGFRAHWHVPMFFASIVLGILFSLQFRTQASNDWEFMHQANAMKELTQLNRYLESEKIKLIEDLTFSRKELAKYEHAMGGDSEAIRLLKKELDTARMQAGLVPVKGKGVMVTLNDSLKKPKSGEDPYLYLIHDVDIQAFINELWAAGAEALAVNEQRVVMSTSVRCVGPTVLVNSMRLTPPYQVRAIGDSAALETALRMSGGVMDSLQAQLQKGIRIDIEKKTEMILPEFKGSITFRFAEAVSATAGK